MLDPFDIELHDSQILDVDLDRCFQRMTVILYAPFNSSDHFIELSFEAILRMEYETSIPLRGDREQPLEVSHLVRLRDSTEQRFEDNIREISEVCSDLVRESKAYGFEEVFHVRLGAENSHRGFGPNSELLGIQIVCRRVTAQPADKKWWKTQSPSHRIPGNPIDDISQN